MSALKHRLRAWHRASALALLLFLGLHLANHVAGLWGVDSHIAFMDKARSLYRQPFVEPVLLALVCFQIGSGLTLAVRGWRTRTGRVAWLQALSGLYVALFLLNHVTAVLTGRLVDGLDTNFYFATAGFHVAGWPWFFVPYYFLAVAALLSHIGCALYWNISGGETRAARIALTLCILLGIVLGALFVAMMAGMITPVTIPQDYLASYL